MSSCPWPICMPTSSDHSAPRSTGPTSDGSTSSIGPWACSERYSSAPTAPMIGSTTSTFARCRTIRSPRSPACTRGWVPQSERSSKHRCKAGGRMLPPTVSRVRMPTRWNSALISTRCGPGSAIMWTARAGGLGTEMPRSKGYSMAVDLTGGIDPAREYMLAKRPQDPEIRDSVSFWVVDDRGEIGLPRIGIEAVGANWDSHDIQVNVAFPDGRVYRLRTNGASLPAVGSDGHASVLGAGGLVFRCSRPFDTWTMSYDGPAVQTSSTDLVE